MNCPRGMNLKTKCCQKSFKGEWIDKELFVVCSKCKKVYSREGRIFKMHSAKDIEALLSDRSGT
jgi:hypothetical protein